MTTFVWSFSDHTKVEISWSSISSHVVLSFCVTFPTLLFKSSSSSSPWLFSLQFHIEKISLEFCHHSFLKYVCIISFCYLSIYLQRLTYLLTYLQHLKTPSRLLLLYTNTCLRPHTSMCKSKAARGHTITHI